MVVASASLVGCVGVYMRETGTGFCDSLWWINMLYCGLQRKEWTVWGFIEEVDCVVVYRGKSGLCGGL